MLGGPVEKTVWANGDALAVNPSECMFLMVIGESQILNSTV
jgi:hypothetical protein